MGMTYLNQIGILTALLLTLGGLLVLRSAEEEKAQRRFLLYLLVVGNLLLLALFVAIQMTPPQDNRPFWQISAVLIPAVIGVLALIALHSRHLVALNRGAQLLALLLAVGLVGMMVSSWNTRFSVAYSVLPGVVVLVLGWAVGRRFQKAAVFVAVLLLLALFGLNTLFNAPAGDLSPPPPWLAILFRIGIEALPVLLVVVPAVLLTNSLQSRNGKPALLPVMLALGLLGYLAYSIFWASVWDQTSDGLGGLALSQPAALVAVGAGMAMAVALTGWRRGVGLLFALLAPLLLYQSFEQGWRVSYHDITDARAERIVQALADYHQREGVYPPTLDALTPRYLLRVPQPVELRGETWCYQGGADFYQLGAFFREFFSMPVQLQVYAAVGEPDSAWTCEEQLAVMKERYYSPMEDPAAMQPTPPTPLPPSEIAGKAETLTPLPGEGNMVWGSWSPDSAYFMLGQRDDAGSVTISFLDGQSGELWAVAGTYSFPPLTVNLRDHHTWLPGGQLLLVDNHGQVVLLTPCVPDVQDVAPESAELLTEILAQDVEKGLVLLKSTNEFWIFDARTLTWRSIPGVTPNPYEAHWDNATWQPGGEQLAIARLNGRDASDGSTLYIIAGDTGRLLHSMPLVEASDQSAPRVDWLSPQELLLMSSGVLRILDLGADPPQSTDVMAGIFGLDLDFPDEIWGNGWEVDWANGSYILTVRANHPRNQSLYLYQSAAGTVDVYDENTDLLLLFPDGQMEQWTKPGTEPSGPDEFVLIDVEEGNVYPPLTITGHTPRDYPRLSMAYLAASAQLAVASSQGISLHTLPDDEMTTFWRLAGQGFAPSLRPAPDGSVLVAIRDQGGVYWIPLQ
ncbi:MAG: hypothetical protein SXV54_19975 [Chloroflexota bacterium]|nr:hypothetical protein [Chloroflexota bacterium]